MPPRHSILIVDDDADLRRMFRTALTLAGFDVRESDDGYGALRQIEESTPSAIVLDLGLPVVSGYVVLQDLAAKAHTRDIPVIIVMGRPSAQQPQGAACLLRKPVSPEQLVDTVRGCIAQGGNAQRR